MRKGWFLVACALLLTACAADTALTRGRALIDQGRVEEGIHSLEEASKAHPNDEELRTTYLGNRNMYVEQLSYEGDKLRALGRNDAAIAAYARALALDAEYERARTGMEAARADQRLRDAVRDGQAALDAGRPDEALARIQPVLKENPSHRHAKMLERKIEEARERARVAGAELRPEFRRPVTLKFRDAMLRNVFDVLSQTSGINFLFDRDIPPDLRTTVMLRDTPLEDALGYLLVTNHLDKKIINDKTILVYPNIPEKQRDYQELDIRTFYLSNADVKQTAALMKTVLKSRDVFIDERLNMLVMRDTPETIRMAEKLIAAQDLADPEVILEVKVLEVTRGKLRNLGAQFPVQVSAGLQGAAGVAGQITLSEWLNRSSELVTLNVTDPAFVLNLQHQDTDTNLLANPRVRVRNREKAKIHIGDRLPVITTTSTANVGVSESVQYLDVGLKLDIEPNVYLEDDVAMRVGLEVSNIVQQITSQQGTLTYRIGTRNTATVLRVANGEPQVLAGLIQDEDRRTTDRVPGLGNFPLLGRLFTNKNDSRTKTEIVLVITPYIVRSLDRPAPRDLQQRAGTEAGIAGSSASSPNAMPGPVLAPAAAQAPEVAQGIVLTAPPQVRVGQDFAVTLAAPPGKPEGLLVDVVYDSARLQALDPAGAPGRLRIGMSGSTAVRFRAIEGKTGPTQVAVENIASPNYAAPAGPPVAPPAPAQITVTP